MTMALKRFIKNVLDSGAEVAVDAGTCVPYGGLKLPPASLRRCTKEFKDDRYFMDSARKEAVRLVKHCGLSPADRVLDLGCGAGRLPLGILDVVGTVRGYEGIDVDRHAIEWCRCWIAEDYPEFRFTRLDVHNDRYNPAGSIRLDGRFRFDFPDNHFDVIYLYSVLTHMKAADTRVYLGELRRLLAPKGAIFLTAYLERDVPEVSINPAGYRQPSTKPLHRVRLNRDFFEAMLAENGLAVMHFDEHGEADGQSGVYLARANVAAGGGEGRRAAA
ncbi:MAG: class I SAM-dependent methyltransferase [Planctomycetota bacterium]|jgi:SAM-dependent methyltransferase